MADANTNQPVSSFSLFTKSKNLVMQNLNTFGLVFLLPFLTGLFSSIRTSNDTSFGDRAVGSANYGFSATSLGLGAGIGLIIAVLYILVTIMSYVLNSETAKGSKPTLSELWPFVKKFGWRLIGLAIVTALVVIAGLIALIVPGLIFIRRYILAPYVMLDKDLSITESMKESSRISKPFSGSVWGIIGVTILLSLPGVIPVVGFVVSFILTTLYAVAPALRYQELKKLTA